MFTDAFKSCISRFKRLDIVINNAGVFDETMENWHTTMNINYVGISNICFNVIEVKRAKYCTCLFINSYITIKY